MNANNRFKRNVSLVAVAMGVLVGVSVPAQAQQAEMAFPKLVAKAAISLARLEYSIENELVGSQGRIAQCICIDAIKGVFMTRDIPATIPFNEMKGFKITAGANRTKAVDAELMGRDGEHGFTFIRAKGPHGCKALPFAASAGLKMGQRVVSVGLFGPRTGNVPYAGTGIVAGVLQLPSQVIYVSGGELTISSSPVMTMDGRVVGIVGGQMPMDTRMLVQGRWTEIGLAGIQGTRFFVPVDDFADAFKNIPQTPKDSKRPSWFGAMGLRGVTDKEAATLPILKGRPAVRVGQIVPKGPAAVAGIQQADIIVGVNGKALEAYPSPDLAAAALDRQIRRTPAGTKVTFDIVRKGKQEKRTVTLAPLPPRPQEAERYYNKSLGIAARDIVDLERYGGAQVIEIKGVIVTMVRQKSAVARANPAGMRPGDVITVVGDKPVPTVKALKAALEALAKAKPNESITFVVHRNGKPAALSVTPPPPAPK